MKISSVTHENKKLVFFFFYPTSETAPCDFTGMTFLEIVDFPSILSARMLLTSF